MHIRLSLARPLLYFNQNLTGGKENEKLDQNLVR